MIEEELISLAGPLAVLLAGGLILRAILRSRRRGPDGRRENPSGMALAALVAVLLAVGAAVLLMSILADRDSGFRF